MSFFDEVETTVANTRFLQAVEDSGPVKLSLAPFEELGEFEAEKVRPPLTFKHLLKPKTVGYYLFKKFLQEEIDKKIADTTTTDLFSFLKSVEEYQKCSITERGPKGKQIFTQYLGSRPRNVSSVGASAEKSDEQGEALLKGEGSGVSNSGGSSSFTNHSGSSSSGSNSNSGQLNHMNHNALPPSSSGVNALPPAGSPSTSNAPITNNSSGEVKIHVSNSNLGTQGQGQGQGQGQLTHNNSISGEVAAAVSNKEKLHPPTFTLAQTVETAPESVEVLDKLWQELESVGVISQSVFDCIYDVFAKVLDRVKKRFMASPHYHHYVQLQHYKVQPVQLKDFRVFRVLGRGAFGAVSAVQKIDTHAIFAMKEMGKKQVKQNQSEWMCINEKKVLSKMRSPFVLNLKYSFHNDDNLYLIFDMCAGGDLKFHLRNGKDSHFTNTRARFYAAEVLLGLEHIHSFDIVYRDLKPTNILLDTKGHVKISDLGLTIKLRKNKVLKHLAGTAGYWAPEIVQKTGTYKTSDYWSFGVFVYEMLRGKRPRCSCRKGTKEWCPFGQKPSMEENAIDKEGVLKLEVDYPPDHFNQDAIDLLEKLFDVDPKNRLGAKGVSEIKNHPYFAAINWDQLEAMEIEPPFVPDSHTVHAHSIGEVGEFNKNKFRKVKLTPEDQKHYTNFTYFSDEAIEEELVNALIKMDSPVENPDSQQQSMGASDCMCCTIV